MTERDLQYVGTDISKTRIASNLQAHGGPDYLCDAHFLPFRNETFDTVYSAALTEHIADPQLMMSEVYRVLKPSGFYLGNGSFLEPWHDDSYYHQSPLGAYRSLCRSGFEVRNVWPGVGYTGFSALFAMSDKLTKRLTPLGRIPEALRRLALRLRRMRGREPRGGTIEWDAIFAGAIDWIAVKPTA
jgi:SAM-dependent methyltransferase